MQNISVTYNKRSFPLERHTFNNLLRRLSKAGFKKDFVQTAILPDWWTDTSAQDVALLPDTEIRVARFLGLSLESLRNPATVITAPAYPGAQLRRVRDIDRDRLAPALHSAMQIAGAVVRSMRNPAIVPLIPPVDGTAWRNSLTNGQSILSLDNILSNLWLRGIPVVPVEVLPSPSFQGLACIVENRPVILIGHKHDEPGRLSFLIGHEAGHIAAGDCTPNNPVVDESEDIEDNDDIEVKADLYASRLLTGNDSVPVITGENFKQLANRAVELEKTTKIEASHIIFAWASRSRDYQMAAMAVNALYRGSGARQKLRQHFDQHINLDAATESDRSLLRCVYGEPENATTTH